MKRQKSKHRAPGRRLEVIITDQHLKVQQARYLELAISEPQMCIRKSDQHNERHCQVGGQGSQGWQTNEHLLTQKDLRKWERSVFSERLRIAFPANGCFTTDLCLSLRRSSQYPIDITGREKECACGSGIQMLEQRLRALRKGIHHEPSRNCLTRLRAAAFPIALVAAPGTPRPLPATRSRLPPTSVSTIVGMTSEGQSDIRGLAIPVLPCSGHPTANGRRLHYA
jgi:hypothetical protein